jgi:hypothetical protein
VKKSITKKKVLQKKSHFKNLKKIPKFMKNRALEDSSKIMQVTHYYFLALNNNFITLLFNGELKILC